MIKIGTIRNLGLIPIILGIAIGLLCTGSFVISGRGTPIPFTPTNQLIVRGLYRFVRNPMYIAEAMVLADIHESLKLRHRSTVNQETPVRKLINKSTENQLNQF